LIWSEKLTTGKTLIVGESRTGKTTLLLRILWKISEAYHPHDITIIDMAPDLSWGIGGKLLEVGEIPAGARYLTSWELRPPRLLGRDADDVLSIARENARHIDLLLEEYLRRPSIVLAVNDATMYVHAKEPQTLLRAMNLSRSSIVTAYAGILLSDDKGSGITVRERRFVETLLRVSDRIIRTG